MENLDVDDNLSYASENNEEGDRILFDKQMN